MILGLLQQAPHCRPLPLQPVLSPVQLLSLVYRLEVVEGYNGLEHGILNLLEVAEVEGRALKCHLAGEAVFRLAELLLCLRESLWAEERKNSLEEGRIVLKSH